MPVPPVDPRGENIINEDANYMYSFFTTDGDCEEMGDIGITFVSATDPEPEHTNK